MSPTALYIWNLQIAEAFYTPLHCLEISLRNSLHEQLKLHFQQEQWWQVAPVDAHTTAKIGEAVRELRKRSTDNPSADSIVAELSFGFWVSLLSRRYDRHLWVPVLHKGFAHYRGQREPLRDNLQAMVLLRNRIMHHEPIHHRHLAADHAKIYILLRYLGPELTEWLQAIDRVPATLALRPRAGSHA
ncbi:hypothetical protein ACWDSJ_37580 [Nocardia sp. NPDC003482]